MRENIKTDIRKAIIDQLREESALELAWRGNENPTKDDRQAARDALNRYYNVCEEVKPIYKRLENNLKENHNATLKFDNGLTPFICDYDTNEAFDIGTDGRSMEESALKLALRGKENPSKEHVQMTAETLREYCRLCSMMDYISQELNPVFKEKYHAEIRHFADIIPIIGELGKDQDLNMSHFYVEEADPHVSEERKMQIDMLREKAVYKLAERANENPTDKDIRDARDLMDKFYQLGDLDNMSSQIYHEKDVCIELKNIEEKATDLYNSIYPIFQSKYSACISYPNPDEKAVILDAESDKNIGLTYYYQEETGHELDEEKENEMIESFINWREDLELEL